jgi:hypothetical protein
MVTKHTPIKKKTAAFEYLGLTDYPVTPKKVIQKHGKKPVAKKQPPMDYLGLTVPVVKRSLKRTVKKQAAYHIPGLSGTSVGKGTSPGLAGLGGFSTTKPLRKSKRNSQNIGDYWGEGFVNSVKQRVSTAYSEAVKKHKEKEEEERILAEKLRKKRIFNEKSRYSSNQEMPLPKPQRKYADAQERKQAEAEEQAAWDNTPEYGKTTYPNKSPTEKAKDDLKGYAKPRPTPPEENPLKTVANKVKNAYDKSAFGAEATAKREAERKEAEEKRDAERKAADEKRRADWVADEPNRKKAEDDRIEALRLAKEAEEKRRTTVALWNEQAAIKRKFDSLNPTEKSVFLQSYDPSRFPTAWSPLNDLPPAPPTTVGDSYRNAAASTQQWATRQVTPQGIWNNTKTVAGLTARGVKGAASLASQGMEAAIEIRNKKLADDERIRKERNDEWLALPRKERQEILEERAFNREQTVKLRQMKQQFLDYQMDKDDAALTGQKFHPSAFKVENAYGEDKWIDQYGRELPGEPSYMISRPITEGSTTTTKRRTTSEQIDAVLGIKQGGYKSTPREQSVITPEPRQSMNSEISDLLGIKQRQFRPASQPTFTSEPADEPSALELMGASPRKRVHRGEQPQQQVQVPSSYVSQPTRRKKSFHEHESKELDQFKNNEAAVMKQLMGF